MTGDITLSVTLPGSGATGLSLDGRVSLVSPSVVSVVGVPIPITTTLTLPVPQPGTLTLLGLGLAGLTASARRRR